MNHSHNHSNQKQSSDRSDKNITTCPVMKGVAVDKEEAEKRGWVKEYQGKKYYLCCESCIGMFDQDPEEYAKE